MLASCSPRDEKPPARAPVTRPEPSGRAAAMLLRADSIYRRDYDSARVVLDSTITLARQEHDSVTLARALTSRGNTAWRLGAYDDAERIGRQALALKQQLRLDRDLAKSFAGLGLLAQARGRLEEAEKLLLAGLAAARAAGDSAFISRGLNNLGLVHTDLGDFARARAELEEARALSAARDERIVEVSASINLGRLELELGEPTAAARWLTAARTRSAALEYHVGEENALGQLARAHASRSEHAAAIAHVDSALTIARRHGLKEPETDDLELMAQLYQSAGQHRRSLVYLARARALADSMAMTSKLAHISLAEARAYAALGNLPMAFTRATALIERLRREGARSDELEAELLAAELAQRRGDGAGAAARLDTAARIASGLGTGIARVRVSLARARVLDHAMRPADVLSALGELQRDTLLLTADEQTEHDGLRARAHLRLGNLDSSIAAGRRAVAGVERIRGRMATGELRAGYVADRSSTYADLVLGLLRRGAVDDAFRVADAARGRALVERLGSESRALSMPPQRQSAELRALLARIELLTARLRASDSAHSRVRGGAEATLTDALGRQLSAARREYEALRVRVAQGEPTASILGSTGASVSEVRKSLAHGEALVEFFSTSDRLLTFVVTRDTVRWTEASLGSFDLSERVRSVRSVIASRDDSAAAPLLSLHEQLIAPLERGGMLAGVRALIVVPHGALTYLPFAALATRGASGVRYLVERYSIVTLASASALPALRARAPLTTTGAAAVLAPLPAELPASRREAAVVAATYTGIDRSSRRRTGIDPLVGASATESALRSALARTSVVHVASHGRYDAASPMFSGVRLASGGRPLRDDDNARLDTHEVLTLAIRSQLVFLSGCETALGPAWSTSFEQREDYVTLAQAFQLAGAQNVVATLWRIEDGSAAEFAGRFYTALGSTSPADALAMAQRSFLATAKYRRPYYWAAYVVSGSGTMQGATAGTEP